MATSIAEKPIVFIDPSRCMGCRSCEVACAIEHSQSRELFRAIKEVPRPIPRIKVVYIWSVGMPSPLNCRHCEQAPCIDVCPTRALYKDENGATMLNPLKCIGCLSCAIACPFGVPELDLVNKIMVKCDLCPDRRSRGEVPACVEACPSGALRYGTVSEIMKEMKKEFLSKYFETRREAVETFIYPLPPTRPEMPLHVLTRKTRSTLWFER